MMNLYNNNKNQPKITKKGINLVRSREGFARKITEERNVISGMRHRREEADHVILLLAKASFEIGLEDLHDGDEALHLVKAAAQLGFPSPGSRQPSLRLG